VTTQDTFNLDAYLKAVELVSEGISPLKVAKRLGIGVTTLYKWKNRDEETVEMWNRARDLFADSLIYRASDTSEILCNPDDNVLLLDDPRLANAYVQSHAQGARTAVEVAKRVAPKTYGDRIEHTGDRSQVAFVVQVSPTMEAVQARERLDSGPPLIEVKPIARKPAPRSGRTGKTTTRQAKKAGKR
jgi:hypothetical protein